MKPCIDLDKYCDRQLNQGRHAAFQAHLKECSSCRAQVLHWQNIERELVSLESDLHAAQPKWNAQVRSRLILPTAKPRSTRSGAIGWAAAAGATVILGAFIYLAMHRQNEIPNNQEAPLNRVVIEAQILHPEHVETTELIFPRDTSLEAPDKGRIWARIGDDRLGLKAHGRIRVLEISRRVTRLELERGLLSCAVSPLGESGKFEIAAGRYSVRVVGTVFAVERLGEEGLKVDVRKGIVDVFGSVSDRWRVYAGQRLRVSEQGRGEIDDISDDDLEQIESLLRGSEVEEIDRTETHSTNKKTNETSATRKDSNSRRKPRSPDTHSATTNQGVAPLDTWRRWVIDGRLDDAERSLRNHLQRSPADDDAWWLLADCQRKAGRWQRALNSYLRVIDLTRGAEANRARFLAGSVAQDKLKNKVQAIGLFEDYLRIGKGGRTLEAEAMMRLARALVATGRKGKARPLLKKTIERHAGTSAAAGARRLLDKIERQEKEPVL